MALTATATQGMGLHRYTADGEVLFVPGDPGDTYTRDHPVVSNYAAGGSGVVEEAADSSALALGFVAKTMVCPAATQAFPYPGEFLPRLGDAESRTLIPVRTRVAAGTPVYKASFANHWDDTVITYSSSARYLAVTTGFTADDYPLGALVYVYAGAGAGQVNTVESYDHTGGAAEKILVCHRAFKVAPDSTSKIIVLGGEGTANYGMSQFGRMDLDTNRALDASDGSNDGDYVIYADWRELGSLLANLTITVIDASAIY